MLIQVAEEFGFTIGSFQHVLEGYKIADEIARHGAGASSFSDWWAYKFEVYDAIPYNGAIMWDRGVNVTFNSDSDELARRLNSEAAKAVKYGGVPEEEALKFVTVNAAKQLGVAGPRGFLGSGKGCGLRDLERVAAFCVFGMRTDVGGRSQVLRPGPLTWRHGPRWRRSGIP